MKWDVNNITDQSGKVVIITGANTGLGFETAKALMQKNAHVVIACRNKTKGEAAIKKLLDANPSGHIEFASLDLSDLDSVKQFAQAFKKNHQRLDILINNAGVMVPPYSKTNNGFEQQMGVNHLGHFALTGLLLDMLRQTPKSRIVNLSSLAHWAGKINFTDLNWEKRWYNKWRAYGDSKLANLYFTYALQKRIANSSNNPIVTVAHPGWSATDLQRNHALSNFFNRFIAQKPAMGALPTLYAAVSDDIRGNDFIGPNGLFQVRGYPKKVQSNKRSRNNTIAEKFWDLSEQLTGISYKNT